MIHLRTRSTKVGLRAHGWEGTLLDNVANASRQGSGFNPLCNAAFPGTSLFRDDAVGWNFEHIFNGSAADASRSMFRPRKDLCFLRKISDASASVFTEAPISSSTPMGYRRRSTHQTRCSATSERSKLCGRLASKESAQRTW